MATMRLLKRGASALVSKRSEKEVYDRLVEQARSFCLGNGIAIAEEIAYYQPNLAL